MKKNHLVIERHIYAPESNTVRYYRTMQKLPGKWQNLSVHNTYEECVKIVRAELRKGMRRPDMHYAVVTFANSGNVYAAGWFRDYTELQKVIHSTGRKLNIKFK